MLKILKHDYSLKNSFIKFAKSDAMSPVILKRIMTEFHGLVEQTIAITYNYYKSIEVSRSTVGERMESMQGNVSADQRHNLQIAAGIWIVDAKVDQTTGGGNRGLC
jgi:hypothetical protein